MTDLSKPSKTASPSLTLNRPERLNALSPAMTAGLKDALERFSTDPRFRRDRHHRRRARLVRRRRR